VNIDKVAKRIEELSERHKYKDGKESNVIGLRALSVIAGEYKTTVRNIEAAALKEGIVPWRYIRNIGTIGVQGQIKLLQSSVAVVGAGGLGGTIIELLARQGVGHIIIIDDDRFVEQNLNRQILSTERNVGKYKAEVAARRVRSINSAVALTIFVEKLTEDNAVRLLQGAKVVADALDSLPARFIVETACRALGIPMVHGTIGGFCGQITTIFPEDAGLCCIYGSADSLPEQGIESQIGNPSTTPTIVAAWQVQEIIKIITGVGSPLRNSLLVLDLMEGTAERININR